MANLFAPRISAKKCDGGVWWSETDDGFQWVLSQRLISWHIDTFRMSGQLSKGLPL